MVSGGRPFPVSVVTAASGSMPDTPCSVRPGTRVGTFCIYDTQARHFDADQLEAFTEIAAWAQRELERADELDRAADIQRQLLPQPLGHPGVEIARLCLPAFVVGGDFYDHYRVRDGVVITVADVMGKGLGAAIVSSAVRSSLRFDELTLVVATRLSLLWRSLRSQRRASRCRVL